MRIIEIMCKISEMEMMIFCLNSFSKATTKTYLRTHATLKESKGEEKEIVDEHL